MMNTQLVQPKPVKAYDLIEAIDLFEQVIVAFHFYDMVLISLYSDERRVSGAGRPDCHKHSNTHSAR